MYEIFGAGSALYIKKGRGRLSQQEIKEIIEKLSALGIRQNFDFLIKFGAKEDESIEEILPEDITVLISPDEMEARVKINVKVAFSFEKVLEKLKNSGVVYGILEEEIKKNLEKQNVEFVAAIGKVPVNGDDGRIVMHVELPKKRIRELSKEGRVNLYDLDIFRFVKKDQIIAEIIPPTDGIDGMTVTGRVLKSKKGEKAVYVLGDNVYLDNNLIRARIEGVLKFEDNKFSVDPVLYIPGDVDISTGNINSEVDVYIKGWVRAGFKVISKKNITIEGGVEKDCIIQAEESVTVKGGIFGGEKTEVSCKKNLSAKFIQDAKINVGGDIFVNEYIMNSEVKCEGSLFLSGESGKLVNTELSLKYAAYVKEIVGGKRKLRVEGFSRRELVSIIKKLEDEKEKTKKIMIDLSIRIKECVTRLVEGKLSAHEMEKELKMQKEFTEKYKKMLEMYGKLESRIEEIKDLLSHVKGEGAVYITSKARDLKVILKDKPVDIAESYFRVLYIDEDNEVKFE
ncbi:MAG: FapA family protein [Fervidobacterium sp.]|nr:FapA family protein [Fervidobacterium sp.]